MPGEVSNTIIGATLGWVRERAGEEGIRTVLELAGETAPLSELEDPLRWGSYERAKRIAAAANELLGTPDGAFVVGSRLLSHFAGSEVVAMLRALSGPADVFRVVTDGATKQSTVNRFECAELGVDNATVVMTAEPGIELDLNTCRYVAGVLSSVPTIFGMSPAEVTESECVRNGDLACVFQVQWDPETASEPDVQVAFLRQKVEGLSRRFESLEQMAADLADIEDVDELLDTIASRAGVAVRAPRYLLAVRLREGGRLRVHHLGFTSADEAADVARQLEAGLAAERPNELVVEIASVGHRYGFLAAFNPLGRHFFETERHLLLAYAGHASAALKAAAALLEARERARTMQALFELASSLSEVRSTAEAAEQVAASLPAVVGAASSAVVLVDSLDGGRTVRMWRGEADGAMRAVPDERLGTLLVGLDPLARAQVVGPGPLAVPGAASGPLDPLAALGFAEGVLLPVVARGEVLGFAAVSRPVAPGHGPRVDGSSWLEVELVQRLEGVVGLASTALDNLRLLEEARQQAHHDPLTGLANPRLLADLARAVLAEQGDDVRAAALFIDLDRFKQVNDDLGHRVGDLLLAQVAGRLRGAVRSGDTLARVGGDEFVVLLPRVPVNDDSEAVAVAARCLGALEQPFVVAGHRVSVGASIGVAVAGPHDNTLDDLVNRADRAMYQAKAAGRARYAVSA